MNIRVDEWQPSAVTLDAIKDYFIYVTFPFSEDILGEVVDGTIFLNNRSTMDEKCHYLDLLNHAVEKGITSGILRRLNGGLVIQTLKNFSQLH